MKKVTRRLFGHGVLAAGIAAPALARGETSPTAEVYVAALSELTVGQSVAFAYPEPHAAMLVKLNRPAEFGVGPGQAVVAYHVACPHMGCPVVTLDAQKLAAGQFGPCVCHGSLFDLTAHGRQIHGRASQDLVRVQLRVDGDAIYATGIVGLPFGEANRI
ncbi:MAG: arsenite oxidase small subunit [Myxococcota bacterium]